MAQEKIYQQNQLGVTNTTIKRSKVTNLIINSLLIAIVMLTTQFIQIKLPGSSGGGLVHLGNVMVFAIAIVFGGKRAAIAAAVGMTFFDLLSPLYIVYAPITFIGKGLMAYIAGYIAYTNGKMGMSLPYNLLGIIFGGTAMIATYYIGEIFLLGNILTPLANVPGNITQIILGCILGVPLAFALKKVPYFKNF
ncbi:MAG: ECF transporter S component [Clostridium sp.]|uniref:ECF transporter S component n=1 Tax=Clostridium sp. TaxID=1506 RepID=UPI002FC6C947